MYAIMMQPVWNEDLFKEVSSDHPEPVARAARCMLKGGMLKVPDEEHVSFETNGKDVVRLTRLEFVAVMGIFLAYGEEARKRGFLEVTRHNKLFVPPLAEQDDPSVN